MRGVLMPDDYKIKKYFELRIKMIKRNAFFFLNKDWPLYAQQRTTLAMRKPSQKRTLLKEGTSVRQF